MPPIAEVRNLLKEMLPEKRFTHSLGVAKVALALADRYRIEDTYLEYAALLHDCGKIISNQNIVTYALENNIYIDPLIQATGVSLYHCEVGVFIAQHRFGINQPLVEEAIRYHATGHPQMSLAGRIVYIADIIEPSRKFKGVKHLRHIVNQRLLDGLIAVARKKNEFLLEEEKAIHPRAIEFWNSLVAKKDLKRKEGE